VHPCSTFSDCCQLATPQKRQNLGVSPPQADRIKRSRQNLARMRIPWDCSNTPNLALTGKRKSPPESPKCKNLPKIVFLATEADTMNTGEIWLVRAEFVVTQRKNALHSVDARQRSTDSDCFVTSFVNLSVNFSMQTQLRHS